MEHTPRLLLIDEDRALCKMLSEYLHGHGFDVVLAHDGRIGLEEATAEAYDLVILNDRLPGLSGTEVLRRIRKHGELPVIMLCDRTNDVDCIVSLELGADDCVSRACNLRELLARLNTILRRVRQHANAETMLGKEGFNLRISPADRQVIWRGKPLKLTGTEFDLLELLFNRAGSTIGKTELAKSILGRDIGHYDRGLDMHISNLRKKLGKLGDGRSPIQTVSGAGYQWIVGE